jgi:hypothetical protein
VVLRPGRQLAEVELAQLPAHRRLVQADAEFFEDPPHKVFSRQRTTPWMAGIGPLSTMRARARRCSSFSFEGLPGALPSISPAGPSALKARTQSRTVCSPTPPIRAASVRVPPSYTSLR